MLFLDVIEDGGVPKDLETARARYEPILFDLDVLPADEDDAADAYEALFEGVNDARWRTRLTKKSSWVTTRARCANGSCL